MAFVLMVLVAAAYERPYDATQSVHKETFNSPTRFVFFAGLGGAGHHLWRDIMMAHCTYSPRVDDALRAVWHKQIRDSRRLRIEKVYFKKREFYPKQSNATHFPKKSNTSHTNQGSKHNLNQRGFRGAGRAFDALVAAMREPSPEPLICLNLMHGSMLSYPDLNDFLYHPDVVVLADAAERAKVDLRVVVLHRDPRATVVSTAVNREFIDVYTETQLMYNQLCILYAQLKAIDAKFYGCVAYSGIGDQIDDIVTFIWRRPNPAVVARALQFVDFDKLAFNLTHVQSDLQRKAATPDLETRFRAFDRVYYTVFLPEVCNSAPKQTSNSSQSSSERPQQRRR